MSSGNENCNFQVHSRMTVLMFVESTCISDIRSPWLHGTADKQESNSVGARAIVSLVSTIKLVRAMPRQRIPGSLPATSSRPGGPGALAGPAGSSSSRAREPDR
jgi:hypothetical protein